jgi:hypothetical protein
MGLRDWLSRRKTESIILDKVEVGWLGVKGTWVADRGQQEGAWKLYVELITRVSVQPLKPDEGLLREALSSLYTLFGETRKILKEYGPRVARPLEGGTLSLGQIAVSVLNVRLRPFLAKWHPILESYEVNRPPSVSPCDHENAWPQARELRNDLESLRHDIIEYADLLARASGIHSIHSGAEKK